MVPLFAYDPIKIKNKEIGWKEQLPLEKYLPSFSEINNRKDKNEDYWKYERVALLIVDFRDEKPKEIKNNKDLLNTGLIDEEKLENINLKELNTSNLVSDLLTCYEKRHGSLSPLIINKRFNI